MGQRLNSFLFYFRTVLYSELRENQGGLVVFYQYKIIHQVEIRLFQDDGVERAKAGNRYFLFLFSHNLL